MGQRTQQELQKEPLQLSSTCDASLPNKENYCLMRELINTYGCHGLIRPHTHTRIHASVQTHSTERIAWQREVNWRKVVRYVTCELQWREALGTHARLKVFQSGGKAILPKTNGTASHNAGCVRMLWRIWPVAIFWWRSYSGLNVYMNLWLHLSAAMNKPINGWWHVLSQRQIQQYATE